MFAISLAIMFGDHIAAEWHARDAEREIVDLAKKIPDNATREQVAEVFASGNYDYLTNVTKAKLEGLFADELALLQPTPGYMRLLKEAVLQIWKAKKATVREEVANAERAAKSIQDKLDRLDEAFLFERTIDIDTYDRHAEKLREELTLVRIERHSGQLEELDVEGILAFAERVLPRASDLWVQASLEQRQRFQQLFFPDGIAFDGNRFVRTGVTAPAFSYLREIETENERMVDQTSIRWNHVISGSNDR